MCSESMPRFHRKGSGVLKRAREIPACYVEGLHYCNEGASVSMAMQTTLTLSTKLNIVHQPKCLLAVKIAALGINRLEPPCSLRYSLHYAFQRKEESSCNTRRWLEGTMMAVVS